MNHLIKTSLIAIVLTGSSIPARANNVMGLDDLNELNRFRAMQAKLIEREALRDPKLRERFMQTGKLTLEDDSENEENRFPGKGHKVGGKKGVNKILGIDEREAKRLRKLEKKRARLMR